jgi:hypothetical protein
MSTISASTTSTTAYKVTADTTGALVLQTGATPTTALTIDASQNITTANKFAKASMPTGSVLQVIQSTYNTQSSTTSNTFADTGISTSITPSSSTSKILVFYSVGYLCQDTNLGGLQLVRGATVLQSSVRAASRDHASYFHNEYLDSPATTSATTYKVQFNKNTGNAFLICWNSEQPSTMTLMEIAA